MSTCVVRFTTGGDGRNGPVDQAVPIASEDLDATASADTTSITATGQAGELCLIYPLSDNVRVAFGSTATTSTGPIAFSGQVSAFRGVPAGSTVSVIVAT